MDIGLGIFIGLIVAVGVYVAVTRKKKNGTPPPPVRESPNDKA